MKSYLITVAVGLCLIAITACGRSSSADQAKKTLTIGTELEYAPFSFLKDGKAVGLDIDVATEACKRIGRDCVVKPLPHFDALIPELALGKIDIVAAGMSPSAERARRVAFVTPHYEGTGFVILAKPELSSVRTLEDLKGYTVAVNQGFTTQTALEAVGGVNLLILETPADALLALKTGKADAFVILGANSVALLASGKAQGFHQANVEGSTEGAAMAIAKDNPELLAELNQAIESMKADGTLAALKAKWGLS